MSDARHQEETDPADRELTILGIEDDDTRSLWWRPQDVRFGRATVSAAELAQRVETFVETMRTVLARLPEMVGQYEVDQITVAAEVSAKGRLSLLGSGGELGGKGGLTFTFRKVGAGRVKLQPPPDSAADRVADDDQAAAD